MLPAGLAGMTLLGGCFRPMLAEDGPSAKMLGKIAFPQFDNRFGYYLDRSLRDRLGAADAPVYRLVIRARTKSTDLAIAQDNSVTRISLTATADWKLYRIGDAPAAGATSDTADAALAEKGTGSSLIGGHRVTSPGNFLESVSRAGQPKPAGPKPVLQGRAVSQSGYSSTASLYATRAAKLDIERRLAVDLGERIARVILARAGTLEASTPAGS